MITLTNKQKSKPGPTRTTIVRLVRQELNRHCHFRGRVDGFQFEYQKGVLTIRGHVPTFYLKQLLQTFLKRVDGVERVNNQVDVVCCDGMSSIREKIAYR
jgi:hypothetical protein